MSWVWLGSTRLDFGRPDGGEQNGERTIWLYADPFAVLGVPATADERELREAYRRGARANHPDLNAGDGDAIERFHDVQQAHAAATGRAEVTVEPMSGAWWELTEIAAPWSPARRSLAVAGLRFAVRDAHRVPLRDPEETVRVTYAGRSFPLAI